MIKSIFYILLFVLPLAVGYPVSANAADPYLLMPIDEVYDGDTIKTHVSESRLKPPLNQLRVRVYGIDTPEMPATSYATTGKLGRAQCVKEAELAIEARNFVIAMAGGHSKMKVTKFKWGKFGGRIIADVSIGGVDIATALIENGYAVPYFGSGAKKDWCQ